MPSASCRDHARSQDDADRLLRRQPARGRPPAARVRAGGRATTSPLDASMDDADRAGARRAIAGSPRRCRPSSPSTWRRRAGRRRPPGQRRRVRPAGRAAAPGERPPGGLLLIDALRYELGVALATAAGRGRAGRAAGRLRAAAHHHAGRHGQPAARRRPGPAAGPEGRRPACRCWATCRSPTSPSAWTCCASGIGERFAEMPLNDFVRCQGRAAADRSSCWCCAATRWTAIWRATRRRRSGLIHDTLQRIRVADPQADAGSASTTS